MSKPVSPEFLSLLASRQFFAADLYDIALAGGPTLHYCGGDQDITADGILYPAGGQTGPYWDRTDTKATAHFKVGTAADQLVVDVIPGSALVLGAPFLSAVKVGTFDAAEVTVKRAIMPTYGDTRRGTLRWFIGRMAEINYGRSVCTFTINSHVELFDQQFPRNLSQAGCMNALGDAQCQATVPTATGVVNSSSTTGEVVCTLNGGPFSAGAFDMGKITFNSGALSGLSATIKNVVLGVPSLVFLLGYLPSAPNNGDTITLSYGCNRSLTDPNGCVKFSNQIHFRGMPFTPQPSVAV